MKKYIILFLISLFSAFFLSHATFASTIPIPGTSEIRKVSLDTGTSGNLVGDINTIGFRILSIVKRVIMGILVIFIVYIGVMMIISMGSDEEQLSSAKRQIWYALIALVFINIPGSLFEAFFRGDSTGTVGNKVTLGNFGNSSSSTSGNIFFNFGVFDGVVTSIIFFLEIMIFVAAIFMITLTGVRLLASRGQEDRVTEAKNKIIYSILALIFVGIIEAWKSLAFSGILTDGVNIFESLAKLALFFAAPVALFFLMIAGYYFITSNGDEERTKKAKSIVVNTLLATLILLASYTFLLELATIF